MQPESSDGFASVGTILPEEGAALLPGGSFRFWLTNLSVAPLESQPASLKKGPRLRVGLFFDSIDRCFSCFGTVGQLRCCKFVQ
jgi:hypothetical protein